MAQRNTLLQVAEIIGEFIQYWGFKSIDGRIWALVYLSHKPIATPEIVQKLGVSKGLVSLSINELLSYGLIREAGKVDYGAITYSADENVASIVRDILRQRELALLTQTEAHLQQLSSYTTEELLQENICADKLKKLLDLSTANKNLLTQMLNKNYKTMQDWTSFLKRAAKLLRF